MENGNEGKGTQDLENFGNVIIPDGHGTLKDMIECPVCFEIPLPPIYLCKKGHIVCNICQSRTEACPLCRDLYCNTRSFFAEEMVQRCTLRCRYSDEGCKALKKGSEMADHQVNCGFRPYKCLFCNGRAIEYSAYQDHLELFHRCSGKNSDHAFIIMAMDLTRPLFDQRIYNWPQYFVKCFGRFFIFRVFYTNSFINAWLCLWGQKSDCANFEVKISIKLPSNSSSTRLNWVGPVRHFRETPAEDIFLHAGCLSVPFDLIRKSYKTEAVAEWIYLVQVKERMTLSRTQVVEVICPQEEAGVSTPDSDDGPSISPSPSTPESEPETESESESEPASPRTSSSAPASLASESFLNTE